MFVFITLIFVLSQSMFLRVCFLWRSVNRNQVPFPFPAVVYRAVAVTVKRQPRVVRADGRPRQPLRPACRVEREEHALVGVRQTKAITIEVNQDGALTA